MASFYNKQKSEIKEYCERNMLDFSKLERMGRCFSGSVLYFQYYDKEYGKYGLRDETPAPVVLIIREQSGNLIFEQTENTKEYLGKE